MLTRTPATPVTVTDPAGADPVALDAALASEPARFVLLVSCPDHPGLVAAVANFVMSIGGNIVSADQHIDVDSGEFFQRVEFTVELPQAAVEVEFAPIAEVHGMQWRLRRRGDRPRVAVLASTAPHCAADLLAREHAGELDAEIVAVISNRSELAELAGFFSKPFHHVPVIGDGTDPEVRADHERRLLALLEDLSVELVVLARYMRVLSPGFVDRFDERIISIHHSFLPAFIGAAPYAQAHARGVKVIGATAHYVTAELDEGPIIAQDVVAVSHRDSVTDLTRKGRDVEVVVLARALRAHLERRVLRHGNRTLVFE